MKVLPDVLDGGVSGDESMREGGREHVEVAQTDDQMAPFRRAAHQLGDLPRLGRPVADVRVIGFLLIRRVEMRAEHLDDILVPGSGPDPRTRDALPDVPVSAEEGRGPPVQRVPVHGALLDRPFGQDGQAAAEDAAEVEFPVGQDVSRLPPDRAVVLLRPALLEADDLGRLVRDGELAAYLGQSLTAVLGEVFEAPAVEGEDADLGGW